MMKIFRAIYRLDFARNYDMIDRPGTVGRLIESAKGREYFEFYGEDRNARRLLVNRLLTEEGRFRSLSAEPTTIVCEIETLKGIEVASLDENPDFETLCSIASSVLKEFKITQFERAGLRLFVLGSTGGDPETIRNRFRSLIRPDLEAAVMGTLGPITDVGYAFDGTSESRINYHFRIGPFLAPDDPRKFFANIKELQNNPPKSDTVMDVDLFEAKVAYTVSSTLKWCRPQLDVASELVSAVTELLQ